MRKVLLLLFIIFPGSILYAQDISEADSLDEKQAFTIHVSPYAQWNEVFNRQMAYGGMDAEVIFHEKIVFGFFGEVMLGSFIKRIVFPNLYEFSNYKYGITTGYNFIINDKFWVLSRIKISQQQVQWTEQEGESFALSDKCMEIRPMTGFNYFPHKKILIGGAIGYNIADGLNLSGIKTADMNGLVLSLSVGIKI